MNSKAVVTATVPWTEPVAPWWHTLLVLTPIAIASVAGALEHGLPNANLPGMSHRLSGYVTILGEEWLGVLLVWWALRRRGLTLGSLVSGRWNTPRAFFTDVAIAVGFVVVAVPLTAGLLYLLGASNNPALANLTPKTVVELVAYMALATSAAFSEELVFRGYLARQFSGWTGNVALGLVLQGVAFGLAHGFYGVAMIAVMLHGWLLGLLAYWRKSLRPVMLAHWLQDSFGGLVGFFS
jgi:uncharacterized protein